MKKLLFVLFAMVVPLATLFAQAPQKMSYQAVVRDANNSLVVSRNVSARISILHGSAAGSAVYREIHTVTTNVNGLMTLSIGDGTVVQGNFGSIDWANGPYFLKSEIDPNGGVGYSIESVQQLMSVPYALYAATSGNGEGPQGPVGPQGPQGDAGATGPQGPAGQDGFSPTVATTTTPTGTFVVITDASGSHQFFVANGADGAPGSQGPQGIQGPAGPAGPTGTNGTNGVDGRGILNIIGPVSNGLTDTYTITYTDGTTSTFTVTNGAAGVQGPAGPQGVQGATGATGPQGPAGTDGRGILNISNPVTNGLTDTYTINYTDGTSSTFTVTNGAAGEQGPAGPAGANGTNGTDGQDGFSPVVTTTAAGDSTLVTITDATGPHTFVLHNGQQGPQGEQGLQGETGPQGPIGPEGPTGITGPAGKGIQSIVKTSTIGLVDTYTITYTDGSVCNYNVTNGADGVSPTVTATTSGSDIIITVVDGSGTHTFPIPTTSGGVTQVPADWNATSGVSQILNKPNLATVAETGDYNDLVNLPQIPQIPADVSAFNNDVGYVTANDIPAYQVLSISNDTIYLTNGGYVVLPVGFDGNYSSLTNRPDLFSGNYNDLTNKPIIPAPANNATLTIQRNGSSVGTFTADASVNKTINITVPTTTSELTNNSGFITASDLPNNVSAFTNDAGYITSTDLPTIPTNVSQLNNDAGYITADQCGDVDICAMANQLAQLQQLMSQMQARLDSLEGNAFTCGTSMVTDYDGNTYNTVKLGNQCWMKENLRTTHYADGSVIPAGGNATSTTAPYYYDYSSSAIPLVARGYLYNWFAAMHGANSSGANPSGVQGVCPNGWHLPSDGEWTQLTEYVSSQSGYVCGSNNTYIAKALASTTGWNSNSSTCAVGNNQSANNATGFSAIPAGGSSGTSFSGAGASANFWSSSMNESLPYDAYTREIAYYGAGVYKYYTSKSNSHSVRCLRDDASGGGGSTATLPTVTTSTVSSITANSATCGGNVTSDGGASITARGVCWGTSQNPTVSDSHTTDGSGTGSFTSSITGLTPNTTYYVRSYAVNSAGTAYGEQLSFTTQCASIYTLPFVENFDSYAGSTSTSVATSNLPSCWRNINQGTSTSYSGYPIIFNSSTYAASGTNSLRFYTYTTANSFDDQIAILPPIDTGVIHINTLQIAFDVRALSANYTFKLDVGIMTDPADRSTFVTMQTLDITSTMYSKYEIPLSQYTGGGAFIAIRALRPSYGYNYGYLDNVIIELIEETSDVIIDEKSCPAAPTVTDHEGNVYATVQIGNQCWMRDNLRTTTSPSTGTYIVNNQFTSGTSVAYTYTGKMARWYNNDSTIYAPQNYGLLYNWNAAVDTFNAAYGETSVNTSNRNAVSVTFNGHRRGICPAGWHLPSDAEWNTMEATVSGSDWQTSYETTQGIRGTHAGKLAGGSNWNSSNTFGAPGDFNNAERNSSGFGALPTAGYDSNFDGAGGYASFWSSTQDYYYYVYRRQLSYDLAGIGRTNGGLKYYGCSVRCLRDDASGGSGNTTTLPSVTTSTVSNITVTSATCGGNVTSDGGASVTVRGVCWGTSQNPTVSDSHTTDGSGTGNFNSSITGLTANTTYYVRAYAINSLGTAYGEEKTFTTTCNTVNVSIAGNTTISYGQSTTLTASGANSYVWKSGSTDVGTMPSVMLSPATTTTYSVTGTDQYGCTGTANVTVTVNNLVPAVTTNNVTNVTTNSASCGGEVTATGGADVTARGVCWSTSQNPTVSGNHTTDGSGIGAFTSNLTGLIPNTTYYVRAYATNSVGTGYGEQKTFITTCNTVNVIIAGNTTISYGQSTTLTASGANSYVWKNGSTNIGTTPSVMLSPATTTTYSVTGTDQYGCAGTANVTVTVNYLVLAVTTNNVTNVTTYSASCGGEVTATDGVDVTARGVCWSTSQNPTVNDNHTTDGSGTGSFTSNINGLTSNTTYYVRAYATNSQGTAYGEQKNFTTANSNDGQPCSGTPTVMDHEGNVYNTVQIGNQCWTKENLRTTTSPSTGTYLIQTSNADYTYTGKQASWYDDDPTTYAPMNYGLRYNWNAAMDTFNTIYGELSVNDNYSKAVSVTLNGHRRGICPAGWHLPSDAEWSQLTHYVSSQSQYLCGGNDAKALADRVGWINSSFTCTVGRNQSTNNATGFSAVPADAGYGAYFWSATQYYNTDAYYRCLYYSSEYVARFSSDKYYGHSVRCLRDASGGGSTTTLPTVLTNTVSSITATSASCGGNVASDGGAMVTARGVCWSTSQNPTVNDSHTTDGSDIGDFTSNMTGLIFGATYYVRAYATNSEGTAYGEKRCFIANNDGQPCLGTPTVTDHEGNVYNTLQIGNQCWTKENMRTTTSPSTGTYLIPAANASYTYTGKQACWYNNDSATYAPMNYGLLYNWNAAVDTFNTAYGELSVNTSSSNAVYVSLSGYRRGICPAGWHLPSDAEWTQFNHYVHSQCQYGCEWNANYIAKALADSVGWINSSYTCTVGNNQSANNATGFSAVPAGDCVGSSFDGAGHLANFWSASNNAIPYFLNYNDYYALWLVGTGSKYYGYSVRCLRDASGGGSTTSLPIVLTNPVSNITATSATHSGKVISDGGAMVTARGVCWSTSPNPTVNDNHTIAINGSGTGSFFSNITGLTANTMYFVRAYATNSVGTAYGNVVSFTTIGDGQPCLGTPTVTDHEGNVYNTVQIGNQCWTKENLRTTTSPSTGTYLILAANASYIYTGKQVCWYNNDSATYAPMNYGLLYNWNAAVDTFNTAYGELSVNTYYNDAVSVTFNGHRRGICPAGWHLPSDAEWTQLTDYVGSRYACGDNDGSIARALADRVGWINSSYTCAVGRNQSTNNATGFSAVPAGYCSGLSFDYAGANAGFWSSSQNESDPGDAYYRHLGYNNAGVYRDYGNKRSGYSVRCLRD